VPRRGFGLVDALVVLALVALLVWAVRHDWRPPPAPAPAAPASTA